MGGHFLSDVLIAWLITLLVILVLRAPILCSFQPGLDNALESGLTRLAFWLAARRDWLLRRVGPGREF